MQTRLSTEQIAKLLESSCKVEGYQELNWRTFLQMMLRELIYQGQNFEGTSITGDDEWYCKLMDAIAKTDSSFDAIAGRHDIHIFSEGGYLDQILNYVFKLIPEGCTKNTGKEWLRQAGRTIVFSVKNPANTSSFVEQIVSAVISSAILLETYQLVRLYFASPVFLEGEGEVYLKYVQVDLTNNRLAIAEGESDGFTGISYYEIYCELVEFC